MKKKIYSVFLIVAVAIMASSCKGCAGNEVKTPVDSTKKDSVAKDTTKTDSLKKDTTHTPPIHKPKAKAN